MQLVLYFDGYKIKLLQLELHEYLIKISLFSLQLGEQSFNEQYLFLNKLDKISAFLSSI